MALMRRYLPQLQFAEEHCGHVPAPSARVLDAAALAVSASRC